jgi:Uma2 family endonuclease
MSTTPVEANPVATQLEEADLVIGPDWNGASMTPDEFDAIEEWDEDYDYELIRGVLIVSPYPLPAERGPNDELGRWLLNYREQHPQGTALDGTLPEEYLRTETSRRRVDRSIWAGLRRTPNPKTDVPTITVEFVSAGKRSRVRDYVEKRQEYREAGVQEYWVIDRFRRTLTVFFADGTERLIQENEVYSTPLLPGFELQLSRLLAVADQWK